MRSLFLTADPGKAFGHRSAMDRKRTTLYDKTRLACEKYGSENKAFADDVVVSSPSGLRWFISEGVGDPGGVSPTTFYMDISFAWRSMLTLSLSSL